MDVRDDGRVRATGVRRLGLAGLGECERRRRYSNGPVQLRRYAVHPTPRTRAPNFGRVSTSQAVYKRHSSGYSQGYSRCPQWAFRFGQVRLNLVLDRSAPVVSVSSWDRANLAVSARTSVTISGLNLGGSNRSAELPSLGSWPSRDNLLVSDNRCRLACRSSLTASLTTSDQCSSTAWTSVTAVLCAPQSYSGGVQRTSIIARGTASTWTTPFSFDGRSPKHTSCTRAPLEGPISTP